MIGLEWKKSSRMGLTSSAIFAACALVPGALAGEPVALR